MPYAHLDDLRASDSIVNAAYIPERAGGTRRTVVVGGARFSAGLEFGRKFGVPLLVTINKSASYGAQWNRIDLATTRTAENVGIRMPNGWFCAAA
jgi:hypothetical protein